MAIVKYIPKKKEVIDRRNPDGGYYEAECEECGNIFYPKRSSAKYCSRSCTVMAYRRAIKSKLAEPRASKTSEMAKLDECNGAKNVSSVLKELNYNINGKMGLIKNAMTNLNVSEKLNFGDITVVKLSDRKFVFYKRR